MSPDDEREPCANCGGEGWVCENHTSRPWGEGDGCCGGAGAPCPACEEPVLATLGCVVDATNLLRRLLVFYSPDEAVRWLGSPHAELHGMLPVRTIAEGRGAEVDAIIDRLESGAYV